VDVEACPLCALGADFGEIESAGVVDDHVHFNLGRDFRVDPQQDTQKPLVFLPGLALGDHFAGGHFQCFKQCGGALEDGAVRDTLNVGQTHR
jgi:hypothetical protein